MVRKEVAQERLFKLFIINTKISAWKKKLYAKKEETDLLIVKK